LDCANHAKSLIVPQVTVYRPIETAGSSHKALLREFWEPERTTQVLECRSERGMDVRRICVGCKAAAHCDLVIETSREEASLPCVGGHAESNLNALGNGFGDQVDFLTVARVLEDIGVTAYTGAAGMRFDQLEQRPSRNQDGRAGALSYLQACDLRMNTSRVRDLGGEDTRGGGDESGRLERLSLGGGMRSAPSTAEEGYKTFPVREADARSSNRFLDMKFSDILQFDSVVNPTQDEWPAIDVLRRK
jgi:hypothetical protein